MHLDFYAAFDLYYDCKSVSDDIIYDGTGRKSTDDFAVIVNFYSDFRCFRIYGTWNAEGQENHFCWYLCIVVSLYKHFCYISKMEECK